MLDKIIEELKGKYDFITEEMIREVKKEYKGKKLNEEELKDELQDRINEYIKKKKKSDKKEFIPLTDFFSYHLSEKELHYHLIPTELKSYIKEFLKLADNDKVKGYEMYQDFFKEKVKEALLASIPILENNPNIERVSGTSTKMVKFHEDTLKRIGFGIGINSDKQLALIFPDKTIPQREQFRYYVYMSREDVLNKKNVNNKPKIRKKEQGFINNAVLLTIGITFLSFLFMYLAINLVNVK